MLGEGKLEEISEDTLPLHIENKTLNSSQLNLKVNNGVKCVGRISEIINDSKQKLLSKEQVQSLRNLQKAKGEQE
jgi:hypothetical protein